MDNISNAADKADKIKSGVESDRDDSDIKEKHSISMGSS
jgi:hypothetical protein